VKNSFCFDVAAAAPATGVQLYTPNETLSASRTSTWNFSSQSKLMAPVWTAVRARFRPSTPTTQYRSRREVGVARRPCPQ